MSAGDSSDASDTSAQSPWLPLSNRADPEKVREEASTARLTSEHGTKLRREVLEGGGDEVTACRWSEAEERWEVWYSEQRDVETVVQGVESGDVKGFRTPNRFTPEYRERRYAQAQQLERSLREQWGKLLHTAMVTLTTTSTDGRGRPRPPVDQLTELLGSWDAVRRALNRVLEGREWEYLAILEPHKTGYVHVHVGVFVKGPVVAEQFQPVIDAHLRNCEGAGREAHELTGDDGVVSVHRVTRNRWKEGGIQNLGAYLSAYIAGDYGAEATAQEEYVRRFYALMWATGRQSFRPSNGAQKYMKPPDDEDDEEDWQEEEWELVGIAPEGDLDDVIEVDPGTSRRKIYGTTGPPRLSRDW